MPETGVVLDKVPLSVTTRVEANAVGAVRRRLEITEIRTRITCFLRGAGSETGSV